MIDPVSVGVPVDRGERATRRTQPPLLVVGGLSSAVFVVTRYRSQQSGNAWLSVFEEKFDVTERFEEIARNLGWTPPAGSDEGSGA